MIEFKKQFIDKTKEQPADVNTNENTAEEFSINIEIPEDPEPTEQGQSNTEQGQSNAEEAEKAGQQ